VITRKQHPVNFEEPVNREALGVAGMISEPASERVVKILHPAGPEQQIIAPLAVQVPAAGVPAVRVRAKSGASTSGVLASAPSTTGPVRAASQDANATPGAA
jgi:hypothetical protein